MKYIKYFESNDIKDIDPFQEEDWDEVDDPDYVEQNQKWVGEEIYTVQFSIFDISICHYKVTKEVVRIDNELYFLMDRLGVKISMPKPFFEINDIRRGLSYKSLKEIKQDESFLRKDFKKSVISFFPPEYISQRDQILNSIDNMNFEKFVEDKFIKLF